ncbi:Adenylosuccinate lyase [Borrelia miyamotoi]|uniref:Adenylosuccinate lyase n=1 Tax=Borrelia miyamotoi TaxID=47466 RepID=A0AAP8YRS5_9SPIR|nr:adenylosuccinate lyase [Borrelia miyamotoi]AHH04986.1 Adenylosuccinate lyase [Borrelia miyamotoi FR64b]ATQ14799.1 adenylosuccinate lyase [Borrelia miyamotoi]ATQ15983.1 adenylosuccinate lyase [Borrelia miyamotoi]ATQ17127.1 adenylosuccinate lyase [Borrelia miyamotoi]ATQ18367.1 adenylosuccinate lyase [Borrelia miyamotoi]
MDEYINPLKSRYASKKMLYIFSPKFKYTTWRKLWYNLALVQKELGIDISNKQLDKLSKHIENIDFEIVKKYEEKFQHEVMAHLYAYADLAGDNARKILHLGVTSAYLTDNTDLIQIKEALLIIKNNLITFIKSLKEFSTKYKNLTTLAYTHLQKAQLTTLGKRSSLWLQSLIFDFEELNFILSNMCLRGVKGTVGNQNSFNELFSSNFEKVKNLDISLAKKMGFNKVYKVTSQIYDRKFDTSILNFLSNLSQSAHKITNDIRFMQHLEEIEEHFEKNQIGSSAMPYKRNPIYSERVASLAKFIMSLQSSGGFIAATQWLERTLDDSACKRINIPQAFLAADAILILLNKIFDNIRVNKTIIEKHVKKEMPFILTEDILMKATKNGGDRQILHEKIRIYSMQVRENLYSKTTENDLIKLILNDESFKLTPKDIDEVLNPNENIGFASLQVEDFIKETVDPILEKNKKY